MAAPEMDNQHHPTPAGTEDDLADQIEGMIDESADPGAADPEQRAGEEPTAIPGNTRATEDTPDDAPSDDELEESVAGLDEMLAESVAKDDDALNPLDDDLDDDDDSIESDIDEALRDTTPHTDEVPSEKPPADDDIAGAVDEALGATSHKDERADESETEEDPDDTDIPEVFGPDADLYDRDENDRDKAAAHSAPPHTPEETPDAPDSTRRGGPAAETADERAGIFAKSRAAVGPAVGVILTASVRTADILSSPLARLSTAKRDLLGFFALVTLFNALAVFVVFVLLG